MLGGVRVPEGPVDGDKDFSRAGPVPVLAQPDALPGAQVQLAVRHGHSQVRTQEARLHVGGLEKKTRRFLINNGLLS